MKEQFVTYEIALQLKELGFDEPCLGFYDSSKKFWFNDGYDDGSTESDYSTNSDMIVNLVAAPLWQQVIDWFREKHQILIIIDYYYDGTKWEFKLDNINSITNDDIEADGFISYEEAREAAILKAIELCKNEK